MPDRELILLLTHSADHYTIDLVSDALARAGARPVRVNTDGFPGEVRLSARIGADGQRHALRTGNAVVDAADVAAVWLRKLWIPRMDPSLEESFREHCIRESRAALHGFLGGLGRCRWLDPPEHVRQAEEKLRQLREARAAGLRIPRTLSSNDPEEVRGFFDELAREGRGMVAKLLTPFSVGMGRPAQFVYTSEVREADLAALESLRHCPMLFQERIEKARELRIAYVDGRCFAGAVDARGTSGEADWRRAAVGECAWLEEDVPAELAAGLRRLMSAFGLRFGAADVIITPEGEHVFLEVNPGGEWGMLQRDLGLPIAEAIADALLDTRAAPLYSAGELSTARQESAGGSQ
jgi:MvdC family ATP-grasp ribosomal peptide maturase